MSDLLDRLKSIAAALEAQNHDSVVSDELADKVGAALHETAASFTEHGAIDGSGSRLVPGQRADDLLAAITVAVALIGQADRDLR